MTYAIGKKIATGAVVFLYAVTLSFLSLSHVFAATLNQHTVVLDSNGKLLSWVPVQDQAYGKVSQLAWDYLTQKSTSGATVPNAANGKPAYYSYSYMSPDSQVPANWPNNPAGKNAMLIESALEYYQYSGDSSVLSVAKGLADQQLATGMTLATDNWPNVPYASGVAGSLTYHGANNGSEGSADGDGVIETDKVGELGHGFMQLYKLTGDTRYRDAAINCANALVSHIRVGNATQSPWPFRVHANTGAVLVTSTQKYGTVTEDYTSHVISPVELFDDLISLNLGDVSGYQSARTTTWNWLMTYPMQNDVWSAYFEDIASTPTSNLNQYNALMTARYLLQHPETDANWEAHVRHLINWDENTFGVMDNGAMTIKEQTVFAYAMGSHTSRYAALNALLYEKTGDQAAKEKAYRSFNWASYMARSNGVVVDGPTVNSSGGDQWFTDGYGDFVRHFMTGMGAAPEWAPNGQTHLLQSSSIVKHIDYTNPNNVSYQTFDTSGLEELKLAATPTNMVITVDGATLPQLGDVSDPAVQGWAYDVTAHTLQIRRTSGSSVVVSFTGAPTNLLPSISLSAPFSVYTAPASITLTAAASDGDGSISKVDFYQDSTLLATVTTAPYTYTVQEPAGSYSFTAKAYDDQQASSTSNTVNITVNPASQGSGPLTAGTAVSTHQASPSASIASPTFSAHTGDLLVAFLSSDGPSGVAESFNTPTTAGLTWTLCKRANATGTGTAEIWTAVAPSGFASGALTATRSSGSFQGAVTVVPFSGADTAVTAATASASGTNSTPSVSLTTTRAGSWVWATGNDWASVVSRVPGSGQTIADQYTPSGIGAFWTQKRTDPTATPSTVTINDTTPSSADKWNLAAIEIVPAAVQAPDTTPPVAAQITGLQALSTTQAKLTWAAATDNVGVTSYQVWRSDIVANAIATVAGNVTTFTDTNLNPGQTYSYRVVASDQAGNSTSSAVSADLTMPLPDTTAPSAPANLVATTVGLTDVTLEWSAASDDTGVAAYQIWRSDSPSTPIATVGGATTSFTNTNLQPETAYSYMVRALDAAGNASDPSVALDVTTLADLQAPSAPVNLQASSVSSSSLNLTWTASTDNLSVVGYNVWRSDAADGPYTLLTNTPTASPAYADSGLQSGAVYYYFVQALDARGNSTNSAVLSVSTIAPDTTPPSVALTAPATGTTVSGSVTLTATASDASGIQSVQFYDGATLLGTDPTSPYQASWDTTAQANGSVHTLRAAATDQAGNSAESSVSVTVNNPVSQIAIDKLVTTKQTSSSATIAVTGLTTTKTNDLLVAFIASDGPSSSQTIKSVTGGNLTWTLRKRANTSAGTSEIWTAAAPALLNNVTVTATRNSGSYVGYMTVAAFSGADTAAIGTTASASALTGAPSVSLTTTRANSWVWGIGNDWDGATTRTVGANQTKVDELLATGMGDTFWLQRQTNTTPASGTVVTVNDTAPTNHRWNLAAIEILAK